MQPEDDPNNQSFDQKPIGQGQKIPNLSEYPPDWNPDQLKLQSKPQPLPLNKRIYSKVWKIKKEALQQLYNEEYLKDTATFITDSNLASQQLALKVLLKFLEGAGKSIDDPKSIIKALVQKCLVVEKGQTPNLVTQIMFWMMDNYQKILLNQLNQNLLNKNPKISTSVIVFLQKLINNYGAKRLKQLQQFGKSFTILSSSVRPVAKQQSINLFKQIYKWIGENVFNFNMHPEVKDQVAKFSKVYVKQPMAIKRGLNQDQKKGKKPVIQNNDQDENQQPQDVLSPYDSRWVDKILEQPKWKQKKSMLEQFIKKTKVKNMVARQSSHFITLIKRLLTDNNINLLQCGFKVVKNLCRGLKKNFMHPCKVILSLIVSKLRDTKAVIVDQAQQTLQVMMNCITIDDMLQDIKQGLKDKAPNMRSQSLRFLQKMANKRNKKMMGAFKNLTSIIVDLNQDGSSEVRDKALDVLCKLKAGYGINFFGDKLKKIQQKKLQTIQNYIDPNNDDKIGDEVQQKSQIQSKFIQKKVVKSQSPIKQTPKVNTFTSKTTISMQPPQKLSQFSLPTYQFQSPLQNTRMNAYQNLSQKPQSVIHQQLIQGFKNKVPMTKESNPQILKLILNCVKKSVNQMVGIQHLELLMYHDWRKCKPFLTQFIQSSKLNLSALQYVKNNGLLGTNQGKRNQQNEKSFQRQNHNSQQNSHNQNPQSIGLNNNNANHGINSLKLFYSSIQSLIPKMSNPDPEVRLQAASTVLLMLQPIPVGAPLQSSVQPTAGGSQAISQLFNVLKYRIQDSNQQIANNYIKLITQMLSKGFLTKYRSPGRLVMSMLLQRLNNSRLTNMQGFIHEMVTNHSTILWAFLTVQLSKQHLCNSILSIIKNNNQSFFKNADQKSYIFPLLTCISKDLQVQKCSQLLDQIVEINGQHSLQKVVKDNKLSGFNIESYLKKWNIHIASSNHPQLQKSKQHNSTNISINNLSIPFPHSKLERISSQIENPWPLIPSPTHIIKMINQMVSMGQPFQSLASPTNLTQNQISIIGNLRADLLEDYSDLWGKWIFWRVFIQWQPKNIQVILNLIYKIINLGFQLQQSQIIVLLGAMVSCLTLHKTEYISQLCKINQFLNQHPLYKEKTFRFWINSFNDPSAPVDQILNLIVNSCSDMIPSEMVTLARFPAVVRNKQFNQYLKANFTEKLLIVYGFKLQDSSKSQRKKLISQTFSLPTLTELQSKYFIQLFQRCSSGQLLQKILQQTEQIPSEYLIQTHLKIMHSVILPYLNRQLSFINIYNYFKYLQKLASNSQCQSRLSDVVKVLTFFLIDLDQIRLQNYSQMVKTINKLMLILLQVSQPKKMLQVLITMMKQQLAMPNNGNQKLILLLPKCVGKVIKNSSFRLQYERTTQHKQCLTYIIKQFIQIFSTSQISLENSIMKTIKSLLQQIITLYPQSVSIFESSLQQKQKLCQKTHKLINQLIKDKIKQNNTRTEVNITLAGTTTATGTGIGTGTGTIPNLVSSSSASLQNTYVHTKDIKNAGNMIKSLRQPVMGFGFARLKQQNKKMTE